MKDPHDPDMKAFHGHPRKNSFDAPPRLAEHAR